MTTYLAVSVEETSARGLRESGPRRDFLELAAAVGGTVVYRCASPREKGWRAKLLGPHVRQAWRVAALARRGDTLFGDGEHIGIPLCLMLAVRGKRGIPVVMLGHLVDRRWKRAMLWIASRVHRGGTLVVHSIVQRESIERTLGASWRLELVPYQVDCEFWTTGAPRPRRPVRVLAVGSEHRDYATLAAAVEDLDADVLIAAGSHWAREIREAPAGRANVRYTGEALPFAALRSEYEAATVVAVPLEDVTNQSGVTTVLEAMSMGRPVVVTATKGQRECIQGPLVTGDGKVHASATQDRGPHALLAGVDQGGADTGMYCEPNDPGSLRAALRWVIEHPEEADRMGQAAREACLRHFSIEAYTARLAALLTPVTQEAGSPDLTTAGAR